MLKFRSMTDGCDDAVHREYNLRELAGEDPREGRTGVYKPAADPRITRIGRLLRVTSLDELPQLINVLKGEMALVGPRPALDWEVALYQPHHRERLLVKPGITGLWQVSGRNLLSMREALDLDVEYVRRRSVRLDLTILARTVPAVLRPGLTR
jgi:lipopolysaccharide/colanic/teichoic acid biosynthesis glycosyltransferase